MANGESVESQRELISITGCGCAEKKSGVGRIDVMNGSVIFELRFAVVKKAEIEESVEVRSES